MTYVTSATTNLQYIKNVYCIYLLCVDDTHHFLWKPPAAAHHSYARELFPATNGNPLPSGLNICYSFLFALFSHTLFPEAF